MPFRRLNEDPPEHHFFWSIVSQVPGVGRLWDFFVRSVGCSFVLDLGLWSGVEIRLRPYLGFRILMVAGDWGCGWWICFGSGCVDFLFIFVINQIVFLSSPEPGFSCSVWILCFSVGSVSRMWLVSVFPNLIFCAFCLWFFNVKFGLFHCFYNGLLISGVSPVFHPKSCFTFDDASWFYDVFDWLDSGWFVLSICPDLLWFDVVSWIWQWVSGRRYLQFTGGSSLVPVWSCVLLSWAEHVGPRLPLLSPTWVFNFKF